MWQVPAVPPQSPVCLGGGPCAPWLQPHNPNCTMIPPPPLPSISPPDTLSAGSSYRTGAPSVPHCSPLLSPITTRTPPRWGPPLLPYGDAPIPLPPPSSPFPPPSYSPHPHLSAAAAAPCLYPCFCRNAVPHLQPPPHIQTDVAPPHTHPTLNPVPPPFPLSHHPMGVGGVGDTQIMRTKR